jgi:hypothetical protein
MIEAGVYADNDPGASSWDRVRAIYLAMQAAALNSIDDEGVATD